MASLPPAAVAPSASRLAREFRSGAVEALADDLVSLFLIGSVVFPGFHPRRADIDFHAVTARTPDERQEDALAALHARLAADHELGRLLDGYYIPLAKASSAEPPVRVVGAAGGELRRGDARHDRGEWALERAHVHAGACLVLHGRHPREIYAAPGADELAAALDEELEELESHVERNPAYAVLNLCRLAYSTQTGDVVVSKVQAGEWALREVPEEWTEVVGAALGEFRGESGDVHRSLLETAAPAFYRFVRSAG